MKVYATESQEQQALFQWARLMEGHYPELKLLHAIPNGGKRDKITAAIMKGEGVRKGVPDICLPVARGEYHGLYIELKRRNGGRVSQEQREWINALWEQNYMAVVCLGWEDAKAVIENYLEG